MSTNSEPEVYAFDAYESIDGTCNLYPFTLGNQRYYMNEEANKIFKRIERRLQEKRSKALKEFIDDHLKMIVPEIYKLPQCCGIDPIAESDDSDGINFRVVCPICTRSTGWREQSAASDLWKSMLTK